LNLHAISFQNFISENLFGVIVQRSLNSSQALECFSFADYLNLNEAETNTHYSNMLNFLLNEKQSNKVKNAAAEAKSKFSVLSRKNKKAIKFNET
jgi:hypothetical protein